MLLVQVITQMDKLLYLHWARLHIQSLLDQAQLEKIGVALALLMAPISAGVARLVGKSKILLPWSVPPFRTAEVLNYTTDFSSPGSPCGIQGFFVSCCQKSWSLKPRARLQITSDRAKSKYPRPTGRGGTVADGGWGCVLNWKSEKIFENNTLQVARHLEQAWLSQCEDKPDPFLLYQVRCEFLCEFHWNESGKGCSSEWGCRVNRHRMEKTAERSGARREVFLHGDGCGNDSVFGVMVKLSSSK